MDWLDTAMIVLMFGCFLLGSVALLDSIRKRDSFAIFISLLGMCWALGTIYVGAKNSHKEKDDGHGTGHTQTCSTDIPGPTAIELDPGRTRVDSETHETWISPLPEQRVLGEHDGSGDDPGFKFQPRRGLRT